MTNVLRFSKRKPKRDAWSRMMDAGFDRQGDMSRMGLSRADIFLVLLHAARGLAPDDSGDAA
jgi:hypothetical protein